MLDIIIISNIVYDLLRLNISKGVGCMMKQIEISIPESMIEYMGLADEDSERLRNAMILYPYVQNGTISNGKAAEMLEISKIELIELYGKMGLPYFDETPDELDEELAALKSFRGLTVC